MIEPDDELRRVLRQWEAPAPSPSLDTRVWKDRRKTLPWKWLSVAAAVLLSTGLAAWWPESKKTDAGGLRPLPDGAITVVKTGALK